MQMQTNEQVKRSNIQLKGKRVQDGKNTEPEQYLITRILASPFQIFRLINKLTKGDILITGRGTGGLVGHAAIMATDYWVLEMPGGEGWQNGIRDNNRRISKYDWFELHSSDSTTLYRNRSSDVAHSAADWAYQTYYDPNMGEVKTQHITYKLTHDLWSKDPSYCSKLVLQAYHYGTGNRKVINDLSAVTQYVVPTTLPAYFLHPYTLYNVGPFTFF